MPSGQVAVGTTVALSATAQGIDQSRNCTTTETDIKTGTWSLTYKPPGGGSFDVTGLLSGPGLSTTFQPVIEGTYHAECQAQHHNASGTAALDIAVTPKITTNVAPAMASSGNNTALVATIPDGRIFYIWWTLGQGSEAGWHELPGQGRTNAAPAAALVGDNHNYLFVEIKGLDGNLYLNQGTLGGPFTGWR
jgi:hypothetical protein